MTALHLKVYGSKLQLQTEFGSKLYIPKDDVGIVGRAHVYILPDNRTRHSIIDLVNGSTNLDYERDITGYTTEFTWTTDESDPSIFVKVEIRIYAKSLPHQCQSCPRMLNQKGGGTTGSGARSKVPALWPPESFPIDVEVDSRFHEDFVARVRNSLNDISTICSLTFNVQTSGPDIKFKFPHIIIQPVEEHCEASHIGYKQNSNSVISLGVDCRNLDVLNHESGHTLGRIHEHCRLDRDKFIHILWANIEDDWESQFVIQPGLHGDVRGLPVLEYDYRSRMSYFPFGDASLLDADGNELPTYERRDGGDGFLGPLDDGAWTDTDYEWFRRYYPLNVNQSE